MSAETGKLTIRLPREDLEFVKAYAKANRMTVTEVIDRSLRRLRTLDEKALSPELDDIIGLLPADIDAEQAYREHLERKHR